MQTTKINISIKKAKRIWIIIYAASALICFAFVGVQYQLNYWNQITYYREVARLRDLEKEAQDFQALIQRYKDERERLATILFTEKDIAAFLNKISDFAKDSQVRIITMDAQKMRVVKLVQDKDLDNESVRMSRPFSANKIQDRETGPSLVFMPIDLSIEGRFGWIIQFLTSLEKYRQLLTLTNVSIRRQEAAYPLLNCKFVLRLYALEQMEEFLK
jgi:Tfp pilus assembly protein PilO